MFTESKGNKIKMQITITKENYYSATAALYWFCVNHRKNYVFNIILSSLEYTPGMGEKNLGDVNIEEMTKNKEDKEIYDDLVKFNCKYSNNETTECFLGLRDQIKRICEKIDKEENE